MSRPGQPHGQPRPYDWQRQFEQPDYRQRQQQPYPEQQGYPQQAYPQPAYQEQPYQQYEQPYQQPYQSYDSHDQRHQPGPPQRRPSAREMYPDDRSFGFRLPGIGLLLSLAGIAVQLLCMLVLPWVSASAAGGQSLSLPQLWDIATDAGAQGFGGWYLVVFSYPLAVLGIVLALASVVESVVGKVLFTVLAIAGIGWLVVRYGVGPGAGLFGAEKTGFARQELIAIGIGAGALIVVLFMVKTGLAMFRRIAGLILLAIAGVHIYAVQDLFDGAGDGPSFGAYGPALGYALSGVAALIGPRRLTPG